MMPDRMVAHNLRPMAGRTTELGAYLEREWGAGPANLGRQGGGKEPIKAEGRPSALRQLVRRLVRARTRMPAP
jgi:hypothetical protein